MAQAVARAVADDDRLGDELLAQAGMQSFREQALVDCIAPLEAALAELEGDPAWLRRCLEIRFMLVSAGWVSDRAAGLRHMDRAVQSLSDHGGLSLAARLGPWCGRHVALVLGVVLTSLRWLFTRPSRRGPSPLAALPTFAVTIGYACGLEYANHNRAGLERLIAATAPLAVFRGRLLYATHLGLTAFPDLMLGRLGHARAKLEQVLEISPDRISLYSYAHLPGLFKPQRRIDAGTVSLVDHQHVGELHLVDQEVDDARLEPGPAREGLEEDVVSLHRNERGDVQERRGAFEALRRSRKEEARVGAEGDDLEPPGAHALSVLPERELRHGRHDRRPGEGIPQLEAARRPGARHAGNPGKTGQLAAGDRDHRRNADRSAGRRAVSYTHLTLPTSDLV